MYNNLLNLHLKLLRECIKQHGQHFRTDPRKLHDAQRLVDQATPVPGDSPFNTLQKTVAGTLRALDLKIPEHMPRFTTSDLKRQGATTYFSSPITRYFIEKAASIKQAFSLAAKETSHNIPAWVNKTAIKPTAFFSTPEHQELGDSLTLPLIQADGSLTSIPAKKFSMPIYHLDQGRIVANTALTLTAGDIIMLSGDYFGLASQPIADNTVQSDFKVSTNSKHRFEEAFNTLAQKGSTSEKEAFLKINTAHYFNNPTLNAYCQQLQLFLHNPNYLSLLKSNIDHFNPWSKQAYESGRAAAMDIAMQAHAAYNNKDYTSANHSMQLSLQYLLYAEHFLTDSFSAGHARVDQGRLLMREQFGDLGSILINDMHNEDSEHGVYATINGKVTKMRGDGHLNDRDNLTCKKAAESAMQIAVDELREIVTTGNIPEKSNVDRFWPQVEADDTLVPYQTARMFKCIEGRMFYRAPFTELDPNKVTYEPLTWFKSLELVIARRIFGVEAEDSRVQQAESQNAVELKSIAC